MYRRLRQLQVAVQLLRECNRLSSLCRDMVLAFVAKMGEVSEVHQFPRSADSKVAPLLCITGESKGA